MTMPGLRFGPGPAGPLIKVEEEEEEYMLNRRTLIVAAGMALGALAAIPAAAQETIKIGLILPMTGPFASTGRQVSAGVKTFLATKGDTVAGKKIER